MLGLCWLDERSDWHEPLLTAASAYRITGDGWVSFSWRSCCWIYSISFLVESQKLSRSFVLRLRMNAAMWRKSREKLLNFKQDPAKPNEIWFGFSPTSWHNEPVICAASSVKNPDPLCCPQVWLFSMTSETGVVPLPAGGFGSLVSQAG